MNNIVSTPYQVKRYNIVMEEGPAPRYSGSLLKRLALYIDTQATGQNHFKWVGISMLFHGVIITPVVATIILYTGSWTPLWFLVTASVYTTFITSLTGSPARWIMKVFFINVVVNLLIIVTALLHAAIT